MALTDATLVIAATAIRDSVTHLSLHNGNPGSTGANQVGTRVASTGTIDADGDITWSNVAFTGLTASQAVTHVGYWSASTGGTYRGGSALSGDLAANAAGSYTVTSVTETSTAS